MAPSIEIDGQKVLNIIYHGHNINRVYYKGNLVFTKYASAPIALKLSTSAVKGKKGIKTPEYITWKKQLDILEDNLQDAKNDLSIHLLYEPSREKIVTKEWQEWNVEYQRLLNILQEKNNIVSDHLALEPPIKEVINPDWTDWKVINDVKAKDYNDLSTEWNNWLDANPQPERFINTPEWVEWNKVQEALDAKVRLATSNYVNFIDNHPEPPFESVEYTHWEEEEKDLQNEYYKASADLSAFLSENPEPPQYVESAEWVEWSKTVELFRNGIFRADSLIQRCESDMARNRAEFNEAKTREQEILSKIPIAEGAVNEASAMVATATSNYNDKKGIETNKKTALDNANKELSDAKRDLKSAQEDSKYYWDEYFNEKKDIANFERDVRNPLIDKFTEVGNEWLRLQGIAQDYLQEILPGYVEKAENRLGVPRQRDILADLNRDLMSIQSERSHAESELSRNSDLWTTWNNEAITQDHIIRDCDRIINDPTATEAEKDAARDRKSTAEDAKRVAEAEAKKYGNEMIRWHKEAKKLRDKEQKQQQKVNDQQTKVNQLEQQARTEGGQAASIDPGYQQRSRAADEYYAREVKPVSDKLDACNVQYQTMIDRANGYKSNAEKYDEEIERLTGIIPGLETKATDAETAYNKAKEDTETALRGLTAAQNIYNEVNGILSSYKRTLEEVQGNIANLTLIYMTLNQDLGLAKESKQTLEAELNTLLSQEPEHYIKNNEWDIWKAKGKQVLDNFEKAERALAEHRANIPPKESTLHQQWQIDKDGYLDAMNKAKEDSATHKTQEPIKEMENPIWKPWNDTNEDYKKRVGALEKEYTEHLALEPEKYIPTEEWTKWNNEHIPLVEAQEKAQADVDNWLAQQPEKLDYTPEWKKWNAEKTILEEKTTKLQNDIEAHYAKEPTETSQVDCVYYYYTLTGNIDGEIPNSSTEVEVVATIINNQPIAKHENARFIGAVPGKEVETLSIKLSSSKSQATASTEWASMDIIYGSSQVRLGTNDGQSSLITVKVNDSNPTISVPIAFM